LKGSTLFRKQNNISTCIMLPETQTFHNTHKDTTLLKPSNNVGVKAQNKI
jgi:hypothetical protein